MSERRRRLPVMDYSDQGHRVDTTPDSGQIMVGQMSPPMTSARSANGALSCTSANPPQSPSTIVPNTSVIRTSVLVSTTFTDTSSAHDVLKTSHASFASVASISEILFPLQEDNTDIAITIAICARRNNIGLQRPSILTAHPPCYNRHYTCVRRRTGGPELVGSRRPDNSSKYRIRIACSREYIFTPQPPFTTLMDSIGAPAREPRASRVSPRRLIVVHHSKIANFVTVRCFAMALSIYFVALQAGSVTISA